VLFYIYGSVLTFDNLFAKFYISIMPLEYFLIPCIQYCHGINVDFWGASYNSAIQYNRINKFFLAVDL